MSSQVAATVKLRANRNMTDFQVQLMARLRQSSPEFAAELGWDSSRNNGFRSAPFEKGLLETASVLASYSYGPGRGIAAISLPESGRFVYATIGLDSHSSSSGHNAQGPTELGLEAWASDWYSAAFDSVVPPEEEGDWAEKVPYGVIFQIVLEEFAVEPHLPNELIDHLMGGDPVTVGENTVIYPTPIVDVLPMFPQMIVYGHEDFRLSADGIDHAAVQRGMAQIALMAGASAGSMSDETRLQLASTLSRVGDLVPYSGFIRAAFDMDPRSIFMALYRGLENLYSYSEVSALVTTLGIGMTWVETAEHLANQLKWRPKEEDALRKILTLASPEAPLGLLIASLPGEAIIDESSNLPKMAASRLYGVRNAVVHVRPGMHGADAQVEDWDEVALQLAGCLLAADSAVEAGKTLGN